MSSGPELPSGTVTFLFTDIEGSTRLLGQLGQERYGEVLGEHTRILRAAFAAHGGRVVDTQGDSFFVAFRRAREAVAAALDTQRALVTHGWPDGVAVTVRMGLHTGEPALGEERYVGLGVHRASRIGDAGHGGQILVSHTTRDLLRDDPLPEVRFRDLGLQRLKGLEEPERIFQLEAPGLRADFPSPRTERKHRRRVDRRLIPVAVVLVAGAIAAGVLLTRGSSGSAQASTGVAADSVGVFDARSGNRIAEAGVRPGPSAIAVGPGAVWVANVDDDSVSRIDPKTNASVDTIHVGKGPAGIAVGGGFVWVANGLAGTVSKIDPSTNTPVQTITVGNGPSGVAYGEGAVWVANSTDRTVTRIDPRTGKPGREVPAPAGADGIAVGEGSVWVTSESAGSLTRIDPRTGSPGQPINVGRGAHAVAVGPGAVWVANNLDGTVSRIDPASNRQTSVITVGDGPSGVAVSADSKTVWVSSETAGTLSQIVADRVAHIVKTGNRPEDVAVSGGTLYVAVRTSGLAHRGDTLTVLASKPFDSIDPAVAYGGQALILTNDGLVAYKRVGGSDGTRLVPDLATSIPTPTDGGTTFTFQLRRGIRYSTGALVQPADFRRGIERSVAGLGSRGGAGFYYSSIVGYAACLKMPMRCDLSKGIATDPVSNTVTFHLDAPDPDFLLKLALPGAYAVPVGTPLRARLPLPATGPYMVASYDAKRGVRLVRNPRFQVWNRAAQPAGYPNELVWRFNVLPDAQRRAVEQGKADVAVDAGKPNQGLFPPPALLPTLRERYASQLHVNPQLATSYMFLNIHTAPFNDARVRRAVNYAIDRNRMVDLRGGPDLQQPTCQVLPPNFNGYRRYCPYTIQPSIDGRYVGPDLAKAQRLVAASGTRGQEVTVYGAAGIFQMHGGNYFVSVLQRLGYKARFKNIKDPKYHPTVADSRQKIQAGVSGWFIDYPSAANFLQVLLSCSAFVPRSSSNNNFAEFCNPRIDREIERALSLQTTDPGAASRLWATIDRDVVDQAPWVFLQNSQQVDFVSRRVGNYQYNPQWGVLLDQLWVR